jgi:hypothetical protein
MITREEIAKRLFNGQQRGVVTVSIDSLLNRVESIIREAVEAERESAAEIADSASLTVCVVSGLQRVSLRSIYMTTLMVPLCANASA